MRLSKNKVNPHLKKELFHTLHQVLVDLRNVRDAKEFLEAFLSPAEYETLAKRIAVAYWLDKGRGYNNIRQNLKVSSATIATIQDIYSKHRGAQAVIQRIKADEWASVWAQKIKKIAGK